MHIVIEMPIDENGKGPADLDKTVKVLWEVWDEVFKTVAVCETKEEAEVVCGFLNAGCSLEEFR
jgi:hypothetical protein